MSTVVKPIQKEANVQTLIFAINESLCLFFFFQSSISFFSHFLFFSHSLPFLLSKALPTFPLHLCWRSSSPFLHLHLPHGKLLINWLGIYVGMNFLSSLMVNNAEALMGKTDELSSFPIPSIPYSYHPFPQTFLSPSFFSIPFSLSHKITLHPFPSFVILVKVTHCVVASVETICLGEGHLIFLGGRSEDQLQSG